jgi:hypothetical protein
VTIRLEILPVKFVLYIKKVEMAMGVGVEETIKSLDRTVRLSVCSENRKSLGCLERFDYYITTPIGVVCKDAFGSTQIARPARKITTQIGLFWPPGTEPPAHWPNERRH